jgi:hypothetical protein
MTSEYVQSTMFGVPSVKEGSFNIYHDESGTDLAHDRYQLHGILTSEHKMILHFYFMKQEMI